MTAHVQNTGDEVWLVQEAGAGSLDAFLRVVRAYDSTVLNLTVRVVGSWERASHIYRGVFLDLRRDLDTIEPETLRIHIYRLAVQACLKHLQQGQQGENHTLGVEPMDRALGTITPHERIVFELRHHERLSLHDVSKILGISVAAAKVAFVSASARLRCALECASGRLACTEFS